MHGSFKLSAIETPEQIYLIYLFVLFCCLVWDISMCCLKDIFGKHVKDDAAKLFLLILGSVIANIGISKIVDWKRNVYSNRQ